MTYVLAMHPPNRIRMLRQRADLSQTELGDLVGLTQGQIGHLENGARNLTLEWMKRIAKALGVSVADLLVDEDIPDRLAADEQQVVDAMRAADPTARHYIAKIASAVATSDDHSQTRAA